MTRAYETLKTRFARMADIAGAGAILGWDRAVMMPPGGAAARARHMATLAVLEHEIITAPDMGDLLEEAEAEAEKLDGWDRTNLEEMRRDWLHASSVPATLVEALTHARHDCEMTWRSARADNDFASLAPKLDTVIGLSRDAAGAKAEALGLSPYEALVDCFDPRSRIEDIDRLFEDLTGWLPGLATQVVERQRQAGEPVRPEGPFAIETQERFGRMVTARIGFDFDGGRLDVSHHPFSGGIPEDSRITTRYDETDFTSSLMGIIHETGHSQYERNRPRAWITQPVGRARGMTMHESQSLLFEMQAGRSDAFLSWLAPQLCDAFGGGGPTWAAGNIKAIYRKVEPGLIRVDADEVTYPMHILLRYRLERQLIAGRLRARDLPDAWRAGMQELLGIAPADDTDGCMQDIHWPSGAFGYFPSYTLGALTAAQLFEAANEAEPGIEAELADGSFETLIAWLKVNIHAQASRYGTSALIERATGKPLGTDAFRRHLTARYL